MEIDETIARNRARQHVEQLDEMYKRDYGMSYKQMVCHVESEYIRTAILVNYGNLGFFERREAKKMLAGVKDIRDNIKNAEEMFYQEALKMLRSGELLS